MWSDIHKSCLEFPKVKEVLELMEDVNHDLNKPKEELDIQNVQQKLLTIEKKFGVCGASQPMVIYLNSKFFYELGRFKKAIDPLNSEKFFNDAIQIAAYIKDTSMVLKIKLELAEIYMLKRLPNFTRFSYELNKELEESKDLFRIAKLLCIFGQHFLRNDKESEEFSSRRAISQFSLAINKLKNATGYDQYFLKLLTSSEKKEDENNTNTTEESIEIKKEDPLSVLKTSTKEQKNWISWLINIIIVTSDLKISIKEYKEAIEVLKEGKVIAEIEKRKNKQVQIVGKMADVYFNCSEWETCLGCYLECIKILGEKTEQTDHLSILYANVAVCLKNLKRFDESLQYKKLSMELMEKPEDKFEMLVQMGELFIYNQISQQRAKISMQYFEEAKKMLEKPNVVSDIEKAKLELGMAIATFMMKNYEDSIKLFEICIPKLEAPQRSSSFFYLSMIEQERGKLNEAIQHAKDGLSEIAPNMYSKSVVLERLYEGKRHQLLSQLINLLHEKKDFSQAFVECEKYRALNLISILKLDGNPITSIGPFPRLVNFLALTGLNCVEYFISIEYTKTKKSNSDSNSNSNNDKEDIDDGKEDVSDSPQSIDVIDTEEFDKKEFLYVFVVSSSGNIHCEKFNLEQVLQDHSFEEKKISDVIYNLRKLLGISDDEKDSHFLESKVSSLANINIEKENLEKANKYLQFLYQLLIEPTLTHLEGEDLVIAPTKELFLLPFYCLQDKNGESLLEKNLNLSFVPSLSSLLAIRECNLTPTREPENKAFLVSDPSPMAMLTNTITDSTPNLPPLPSYSENWKQESTQIVDVWNTLKVENILSTSQVDSTSEFFYKNYGRCKYLHLSTHFCAEEISPSVNHFGKFALAVNEEIQNSGWISAHLTNYRLPFCSEVVSLSSVVTLSGKLKGDSLSESLQSFIRSGSQSVLSPIASFPQHSFSRLLQLFYSSLSKFPENKAKALRHSLLQIKSESKDNLNPLLWSSYLLFGSTDPFIENLGMSAGLNSLTI